MSRLVMATLVCTGVVLWFWMTAKVHVFRKLAIASLACATLCCTTLRNRFPGGWNSWPLAWGMLFYVIFVVLVLLASRNERKAKLAR